MLGARRGERKRALYGNRLVLFPPKKRPALTDLKLDRGLLIWTGVQVRRAARQGSRIGLRGLDGATRRNGAATSQHNCPPGSEPVVGRRGQPCFISHKTQTDILHSHTHLPLSTV